MRRVALEPGLVDLPEKEGTPPRLLGSRCDACGAVFHPARPLCLACHGRALSDVKLETCGTIYACTQVRMPLRPSQRSDRDYWVAHVDLDGGPRVQALLAADVSEPRIGMRVRLALETLRITEDGDEIVAPHFRAEPSAT